MPGMRLFGRRCALATDDFFFIGAIDSIIFLPWLAWIPVIYASYLNERKNCDHTTSLYLTDVSLPSLCILFSCNWIIACLFLIFSIKGSISNPEPRRHVVTLVYVKLFISVLDIACAVLGTVILVNNSFCEVIGLQILIEVTTIFLWFATLVRLGMIILFYDWNSSKNAKVRTQKEYFTHDVRRGTMKRWHFRFQALFLWCTTPSAARKEALKTASEMMALVACDLDLVASDVIAGMLLYRKKCRREWKSEKEALNTTPHIADEDGSKLERFPPESLPAWMNLQSALRYFNLGLGVFGWAWYVYRNLSCGCCHLFTKIYCCFPFRRFTKTVLGDNCCGCNLAGLQATTSLPYDDLVHVSFVDRVYEVPFFVTYDHKTKVVLVTARGTMSMDDVLTDISAAFACIDDPGCPPGSLGHYGMLRAAREIKRKIDDKGILEKAFQENPDYQLVVTGHSLGASVASLLTILFKESYPNVRCYAFAPAPTVNKAIIPYSLDCIVTIVYGNDSVVYLNYENIKNMVNEMVNLLRNCNLPKFKIFLNLKEEEENSSFDENDCRKDSGTKENGKISNGDLEKNTTVGQSDVENGVEKPCVSESLFVAGTIVHLRKAEDGYRLKVSRAEEYKPLSLRPSMIYHHFPHIVQRCMEHVGQSPVIDAKSLLFSQQNGS